MPGTAAPGVEHRRVRRHANQPLFYGACWCGGSWALQAQSAGAEARRHGGLPMAPGCFRLPGARGRWSPRSPVPGWGRRTRLKRLRLEAACSAADAHTGAPWATIERARRRRCGCAHRRSKHTGLCGRTAGPAVKTIRRGICGVHRHAASGVLGAQSAPTPRQWLERSGSPPNSTTRKTRRALRIGQWSSAENPRSLQPLAWRRSTPDACAPRTPEALYVP